MKKIIFAFLALAVFAFTALSLTGCDNNDHTHSFGNWKHNETQHWKECSCGEKKDIANHTFSSFVCTVCGYEQPDCDCPEGTVHFIGDTLACNSEKNCDCEHGNFEGARVNGIAVTNRENVDNFPAMVAHVEDALGWFTENQNAYIAENIKEIKIILGASGVRVPPPVNGILTVDNAHLGDDIFMALELWLGI